METKQKQIDYVIQTISLLSSMIKSGENHSDTSHERIIKSYGICEELKWELTNHTCSDCHKLCADCECKKPEPGFIEYDVITDDEGNYVFYTCASHEGCMMPEYVIYWAFNEYFAGVYEQYPDGTGKWVKFPTFEGIIKKIRLKK